MDKHVRPTRFDVDLTSPNVEKEWKHWLRTFDNFVGTLTLTGDANAQQATKLQALTNYVSASVYEYISEATDYDGAINILKNLYVKPKNVIYNRHKLATRAQSEEENVDQYMQNLEQLSKHCEFATVSAEQNRKEYIRDAFINGLASNNIRQRLLENNNLSLEEAYQKARTLELAQKHSSSYPSSSNFSSVGTSVAAISESMASDEGALAATQHSTPKQDSDSKCYFCGGS